MQEFSYSVDIVLCIDATASMAPVIKQVKENALHFHSDLQAAMEKKDKKIDELRLRVIVFRDFFVDGPDAIAATEFIRLPQDSALFDAAVRAITAHGGGDEPESGLEALALAIKSDWTTSGTKRRHVIVLWTDASAHPLEKASSGTAPKAYPADLPKNFGELVDLWGGQTMNYSAKRLLIYAPDASPWNEMEDIFANTVWYPSQAGKGLADHDYNTIIETVANSV